MNTSKIEAKGLGKFLSDMIMPNIGVIIAWGLIAALFLPSGWMPNEYLAQLVDPMVNFLIPLLIAYKGGELLGGEKGGVVGAAATLGVIVGSNMPMFLGAMIMGPLGGFIIKHWDKIMEDKIHPSFEVLVENFSTGIIAAALAIFSFTTIGPIIMVFNNILKTGIEIIVSHGLLPIASLVIEPAKVLFLNAVINNGILLPLGIQEAREFGKSIFFLVESNPGPGVGILLAYWFFGDKKVKSSAPGALIIHFLGGIHEIYFPYVLMKPILLLAVIAGGASGIAILQIFNAGLIAAPSVGSILTILVMCPKDSYIGVILSILISTAVSFLIASILIKRTPKK